MNTGRNQSVGVRRVKAGAASAGQRLDNFLLRELQGVPRSRVYRLLRRGEVRVNGKRKQADYRLAAEDEVRLPPLRDPPPPDSGTPRVPDALLAVVRDAIVHEDPRLLVLNKPAGLAVHGGSGLAFGVIEALRALRPDETLELVHRLDRDTSGCLLVARRRAALVSAHALLREGAVEKHYAALVVGRWRLGRKTIDAPVLTDARQGGERVVRVHRGGKIAVSIFDPVAGDEKYGNRESNAPLRALGLRRMFLHAASVSFRWPEDGTAFRAEAPLPAELEAVLAKLRLASGQG